MDNSLFDEHNGTRESSNNKLGRLLLLCLLGSLLAVELFMTKRSDILNTRDSVTNVHKTMAASANDYNSIPFSSPAVTINSASTRFSTETGNNSKPITSNARMNLKAAPVMSNSKLPTTSSTSTPTATANVGTVITDQALEQNKSLLFWSDNYNGKTASNNNNNNQQSHFITAGKEPPQGCQKYNTNEYAQQSRLHVNTYDTREMVKNTTMEFIDMVQRGCDHLRSMKRPEILLETSRRFEPAVVGEEFLHFGNQTMPPQMGLLGKKLALKEAIKVVWLGGSNTQGRSAYPFFKQVGDMINDRYPLSKGLLQQQKHEFVNMGGGGQTSCYHARGFIMESTNVAVNGADLVFIESSVNDRVLKNPEERLKCLESLILRIRTESPAAIIVALCLKDMEWHHALIQHYNLPQIYLGEVFHVPAIKGDNDHVNDVGSFLIRQAVGVFLQETERFYCSSSMGGGGRADGDESENLNQLPPRLFEPVENYEWRKNFDTGGKGLAIHNIRELQAACTFALATETGETNSPASIADDTTNCSSAILAQLEEGRVGRNADIPCDGCPNIAHRNVEDSGGGWTWCGSKNWKVCRPDGVHHHHCPSSSAAGIFVQTFSIDNIATEDRPADSTRVMDLIVRLLKGYDTDFGKALVVAWINEDATLKAANKSLVTQVVDTKWEKRATVLEDVRISQPLTLPPPNEYEILTLTVAILPLDLHNSGSSQNETFPATNTIPRCRLAVNAVIGEYV